jgi:hypothetical protein
MGCGSRPFTKGCNGSEALGHACPLLADSVEKVGSLKLPEYWSVKTPFLHAAP